MVGDLTPRLEKLSLVERTRTTSPKKCWCECPPGARSRATCAYCSAETASSSPQPCSPAALTQPSSGEDESDENGCPGSPLPVHPRGSEAGVEATPPPPSEPKTVSAREREPARIASSGPLRLSYLVPLTCGCRTKRDEPCSRSTANARRCVYMSPARWETGPTDARMDSTRSGLACVPRWSDMRTTDVHTVRHSGRCRLCRPLATPRPQA